VSLQARAGQARIGPRPARAGPWPARAGPQAHIKLKKKKLALVYINYFFYGLLH